MATLTLVLVLLAAGVLLSGLATAIGGRPGQIMAVLAAVAGGVALVLALAYLPA